MRKILVVLALIGAMIPVAASAQVIVQYPSRPSGAVVVRDAVVDGVAYGVARATACAIAGGCGYGIPYGAPMYAPTMYAGPRMVRVPGCGNYPAGLEHLCQPTPPAVTVIIIERR